MTGRGILILVAVAGAGTVAALAVNNYLRAETERLCERALEMNLRSPASLEIRKTSRHASANGATVSIEYDAQNGFGAMLRGHFRCTFETDLSGDPKLVALRTNGEELEEDRVDTVRLLLRN